MLSLYAKKLQDNNYLNLSDYEEICKILHEKKYDIVQLAGLLVLISQKSLTPESLSAFVKNILKYSHTFDDSSPMIDIVGTGGDGIKSINISTAASIILASLGVKVAKHGNRAISSSTGSSDVLTQLGMSFSKDIKEQRELLQTKGLTFFHAPFFHPLVGEVAETRKRLAIGTVFNILGPLLHPNTSISHQLVGIYHPEVIELYAKTIALLGRKRALVVRGLDGLDEISISTKTKAYEIRDGFIKSYDINPADYGFKMYKLEEIKGGDAKENAQILKDILSGKQSGAKRDIVVLNAMFALSLIKDIPRLEAKKIIEKALDDGTAIGFLQGLL